MTQNNDKDRQSNLELPPRPEELNWWGIFYVVQFLAGVAMRVLFRAKVFHPERVPRGKPVILASNHQSFLDPIAVGSLTKRPVCFLGRDSLFRGAFGWLIRHLGTVPIRREGAAHGALRVCEKILERGRPLVFFPEGTRSRDGKLQPLKGGLAVLVRRTGLPIVPVLVVGSFKAWPRHRKFPRLHPVRVYYGEPIISDKKESSESLRARLTDAYRSLAIEAGAEEMLEPTEMFEQKGSSSSVRSESEGLGPDKDALLRGDCSTDVSVHSPQPH